MSDQADQLRRLVRETVQQNAPLQLGPPLVVVNGSQSGVGTTTIAIQLAKELTTQGKRTVLVDANPAHSDIARKWSAGESIPDGLLPPANRELRGALVEVLGGDRTVLEVLQPLSEGVRLLPGHWNLDAPPKLDDQAMDRLFDGLHRLQDSTDVIVVDLGHGMSPWVHRFWYDAQQVLLVTTSTPAAVRSSYATLKRAAIDSLHEKVRIVVNRCWEKSQARNVFARLDHTCHRFLDLSLSHVSLIAEYPDGNGLIENHPETNAKGQWISPTDPMVSACLHVDDFPQSVRLLAAEVISQNLMTHGRRSHRFARPA